MMVYPQTNYMQQQYQQPFQNQYQYPKIQNGINWVQGIEGAKAWQLQPNSNVMLLDSDNDGRFYVKVSDNVGMCTLRIFDYVEVTNQQSQPNNQQVDMSRYVTRDELQKLLSEMNGGIKDAEQPISTIKSKPLITE